MTRLFNWIWQRWVVGALFMAGALLALAPLLAGLLTLPGLLIYLCLPAYMLHQVEEHTGDRFRAFVNQRIFGGVEALSREDVLWINLPGVWGVILVAIYAAQAFGPGAGLVAPYLMVVNAVTHVVVAIKLRGYNPGLITSLAIFAPLGAAALWIAPASLGAHMLGLGLSLLIHAAIVVRVKSRARALERVRAESGALG